MVKPYLPIFLLSMLLTACGGSVNSEYSLEADTIQVIEEAPEDPNAEQYEISFSGVYAFAQDECRRRETRNRIVDFIPSDMQEYLEVDRLAYVEEFLVGSNPEMGTSLFLIGDLTNMDPEQTKEKSYWLCAFHDGEHTDTKYLGSHPIDECGERVLNLRRERGNPYLELQEHGCVAKARGSSTASYLPENNEYWVPDSNGSLEHFKDPYSWMCIQSRSLSVVEQAFVALPHQAYSPMQRLRVLKQSPKAKLFNNTDNCYPDQETIPMLIDSIVEDLLYMSYTTSSSNNVESDKYNQVKLWPFGNKFIVAHTIQYFIEDEGQNVLNFFEFDPSTRNMTRQIFSNDIMRPITRPSYFSESLQNSEEADYLCGQGMIEYDFHYLDGYFRAYFNPNGCQTEREYDFALFHFENGKILFDGMYTEESWEAEQNF